MYFLCQTFDVNIYIDNKHYDVMYLSLDGGLHLWVAGLVEHHAGEEILDERQEERLVLVDQLRQVHVAQYTHHARRLRLVGVRTLRRAQRTQHRQDVAQTKVVMHLHEQDDSSVNLLVLLCAHVSVTLMRHNKHLNSVVPTAFVEVNTQSQMLSKVKTFVCWFKHLLAKLFTHLLTKLLLTEFV